MPAPARTLYLICYDIANPRRLSRVYRFLRGYRIGGQKSFLECWLTPAELRDVQVGLTLRMNLAEDRAHLFQLDPRQQSTCLGAAMLPHQGAFMIL